MLYMQELPKFCAGLKVAPSEFMRVAFKILRLSKSDVNKIQLKLEMEIKVGRDNFKSGGGCLQKGHFPPHKRKKYQKKKEEKVFIYYPQFRLRPTSNLGTELTPDSSRVSWWDLRMRAGTATWSISAWTAGMILSRCQIRSRTNRLVH